LVWGVPRMNGLRVRLKCDLRNKQMLSTCNYFFGLSASTHLGGKWIPENFLRGR